MPLFSTALVERLRETFSRGEQAILLQPRRGFAPFLLCRDCGFDFRCSNCSVSRTVHDRGRRLVCHYCGEKLPRPERCPECGGSLLEAIGAGTERVAERFAEIFPDVPWTILDRDAARRRGVEAVVDDVLSGRARCLIGTQMVAKGHDFPNVTAVGVLSADSILNFPDFRAAEKTFQLLSQVAGRAGRGESPGTVHVQTFHPAHPAIRRAAAHDVRRLRRGRARVPAHVLLSPLLGARRGPRVLPRPGKGGGGGGRDRPRPFRGGRGEERPALGTRAGPSGTPPGKVAVPDPSPGGRPGRDPRDPGGRDPGPSAVRGAGRGGRGSAGPALVGRGLDCWRRCRPAPVTRPAPATPQSLQSPE